MGQVEVVCHSFRTGLRSLVSLLLICWLVVSVSCLTTTTTRGSQRVARIRDLSDSSDNQICSQLETTQTIDLNLRAAIIFSDKLYLLSKDWLIYEIPNTNFEQSFGKMLLNVESVPIENKWPAFATNERFAEIKNRTQLNIYSIGGKLRLIYIDLPREEGLIYIMNYKVPLLINGMKYSILNSDRQETTITDLNGMYTVEWVDGQYSMLDWKMQLAEAGNVKRAISSARLWLYYTVNKTSPLVRNRITITRQRIDAQNDPYLREPSGLQLIPVIDWNMPCGFRHNGYFHLFDKNRIFIFSSAVSRKNQSLFYIDTLLHTINARDYFGCQSMELKRITYPPITTPNPQAKFFTMDKSKSVPARFALVLEDLFATEAISPPKYGSYIIAGVLLLVGTLMIIGVLCYSKHRSKPPPPANARSSGRVHHRASPHPTASGATHKKHHHPAPPAAAATETKIFSLPKESGSGHLTAASSSVPKSKICSNTSSHL